MRIFHIFFLILILPLVLKSDELEKVKSEKELFNQNFIDEIKVLCKSKLFYINLKGHKTYPKFGTVNKWKNVCRKLAVNVLPLHDFFRSNFSFYKENKSANGLLTGYYEPEIEISTKRNSEFKFPILKKRNSLKLEREKILKSYSYDDVLYWTNDDVDLFFLQIQGSGLGRLPNGKLVKLIYDGNNGYEYTSIGKILIDKGFLKKEQISLFSIKAWLRSNPKKKQKILFTNKRYIFFKKSKFDGKFAFGAMGSELIPNLSIAVDKNFYPLGIPMLLNIDKGSEKMVAITHDTGSAIKGKNRADLYLGKGNKAEKVAGNLKKTLQLFVFVPYN